MKTVELWKMMVVFVGLVICVNGPVQGEILQVPAYGTPTVTSSTVLEEGQLYVIEARGTYIWWGTGQTPADAEWWEAPYTAQNPLIPGEWYEYHPDREYWGDLLINETPQDWMGTTDGVEFATHTYSPIHVYRVYWLGTGEALDFRIEDWTGANTMDNSGSLEVEITLAEPADCRFYAEEIVEHSDQAPDALPASNVLGAPDSGGTSGSDYWGCTDFSTTDPTIPGFVIVDFGGRLIANMDGDEIIIHLWDWPSAEGESFEVFASMDGFVFHSVGIAQPSGQRVARASASFDLADAGMVYARYIKIVNGVTNTQPQHEGPDIDAVEIICELLDPTELLMELAQDVIDLNLQQGISNSLDAKLSAAMQALDDINENNDVAAINTLQAFINAVEAQRGNKIPEADADALIAAAQEIIDLLGAE